MKLASIQKISKLTPIAGADLIETATVLGWEVVVKKGEFLEGDLCTYIQIDTVVPEKPEFEFLRSKKFRIKTIKLRNQISQGLIIPVPKSAVSYNEGDDVTDIIGVVKYEKPDNNPIINSKPKPETWQQKLKSLCKRLFFKAFPMFRKSIRSKFPKELVPITDEERIQNMPHVLEQYKGRKFVISHKLDGSSITIIHSRFLWKNDFRICSRRFELHDKTNNWYKVFNETNFKYEILKLVDFFRTDNIIVQGEAIGEPFNGNHHNLKKNEIRLFNIYVNGVRLNQLKFIHVCEYLNIPHCPLFAVVTMNHSLQDVLNMSEIKDILNPEVEAEGLVWRCIDDRLSFKAINNKYLLTKTE